MTTGVEVAGRPDVWRALDAALDVGLLRPRLADGVEVVDFTTRWGGGYTMVKNPRGPAFYRFDAHEGEILHSFDGSRTVREIAADRLAELGVLDADDVTALAAQALEADLLTERWVDTGALLAERLAPQSHRLLRRALTFLRRQTIETRSVDPLVGWLYAHGGRHLFGVWANVLLVCALVGGTALFVLDVTSRHFSVSANALATTFGAMLVFNVVVTVLHELGHALAVRHAGRHVLGSGFKLYFGSPAFFVEASDVMLAPPRKRIVQSWFGPYLDLVVSASCAAAVWFFPDAGSAQMLFNFAALGFLAAVMNLVPFLELDGYWILMDALQTTDLRPRSLAFLRHDLPRKLRAREPLTRFERVMTAFGIVGVAFTVLALLSSYVFWKPIFGALVSSLWRHGIATRVLLVLLAIVVLAPLVQLLLGVAAAARRRADVVATRLRFRSELGWRREAGAAISEIPLLSDVPLDALNELAGRVELRRYAPQQTVVRQGEAATAFFVIRRGSVAVVEETPDGEPRVLKRLHDGASFGELALLQSTPRTATVRAEQDTELFVVGKGAFDRLLADHVRVPELAASVNALAEIWALPPFRHLDADGARAVAGAGRWVAVPPGSPVVREGEPGDAFYVVGAGRLVVTEAGVHRRELGPGDHFGEIALLLDVPRTATVTARTPVRVFRLDRDAFDAVVAGGFRSGRIPTQRVPLPTEERS